MIDMWTIEILVLKIHVKVLRVFLLFRDYIFTDYWKYRKIIEDIDFYLTNNLIEFIFKF